MKRHLGRGVNGDRLSRWIYEQLDGWTARHEGKGLIFAAVKCTGCKMVHNELFKSGEILFSSFTWQLW